MYKQLLSTGLLTLLACGPAAAEILRGEVYQVGDGDVYVTMKDSTVARVPVETATFYVDSVMQPWNQLQRGQDVVVDYEPVYGFQKYYYESADVENPNKMTRSYLIQDVDIATTEDEYIEYEGKVYRLYPTLILEEQ